MTIHMVLIPPGTSPETIGEGAAERTVFIPDRFNWAALVFTLPWLLVKRLWLVLVVYLLVGLAAELASRFVVGPMPGIATAALSILFAFEANGLWRWTLERRGWQFVAVIEAQNREEAERRFFARLAAHQAQADAAGTTPKPETPPPHRPGYPVPRIGAERVVGLSLAPHQG